jgi:hypothetical protein
MAPLTYRKSVLVSVVSLTAAVVFAAALSYGAAVMLITNGGAPAIAEPVGGAGGTLPVGSNLPSAEQCAAYADQVGSDREARPENTAANLSVPRDLLLPPWPDFWDPSANRLFVPRIDGQYTGTTDQIIVWGACKWGINTDVVRAMAMAESSWRQAHIGDYVNDPALCVGGHAVPCPTSFGLLQLKHTTRPGSWPNSQQDTAFNVDYSLAVLRGCFEGWVTYLHNGYAPGDLWGCVGWHYSGEWKDDLALRYVQRVQHLLDDQPWTRW